MKKNVRIKEENIMKNTIVRVASLLVIGWSFAVIPMMEGDATHLLITVPFSVATFLKPQIVEW